MSFTVIVVPMAVLVDVGWGAEAMFEGERQRVKD